MIFGYVFFLIFTFPIAVLIHSVLAEKLNLIHSALFKAIIFGVLCSPVSIVIGEGYRNRTIGLGLFALFEGYDTNYTLLQILGVIITLYIYFKVKKNS